MANGECDTRRNAVAGDRSMRQVDLEAPDMEQRVGIARIAAGDGRQPRRQLAEVEGLDQIVVGAGVEAIDTPGNLVHRGEDDDRRGAAALAQAPEEIEAAAIGQVEVEQDQLERHASKRVAGFVEAPDPIDGMPIAGDVVMHRLAQARIVLDQQYAHDVPRRSLSATELTPA